MNYLQPLKTLTLALVLSIGVSYAYAAWAPPTNAPTGGNAEAPINVGSATQLKAGGLSVSGLLRGYSSAYFATDPGSSVGIGVTSPTEKLDVNGNVKAISFFYSSDERLKKGITTLSGSLEKILNLRGVQFKWKNGDDAENIGFIAQEVEKVVPQVVKDGSDGLKSVEYGNIVPLLVEAMKEQQKEIDSLKMEIETLKSNR